MGFLINCPNCGERNAYEFRFGGEISNRPKPDAPQKEWADYLYVRRNVAGEEREWCYHNFGCRKWFISLRNTVTNEVLLTMWPEEDL